jgi:HSP20 family protein
VSAFSPQVDAYENEKGYQIEVALPGLKRDDIKVDFQQGRLTISGERHFKNEQNDRRYHIVESSYGSFILRIMVPKNEEKTMRHQIQIQGSESNGQPAMSNGQPAMSNGQPAMSNGQPAMSNGQVSEHMGQQATDVQVQSGNSNGNGQSSAGGQGTQREVQMAAH